VVSSRIEVLGFTPEEQRQYFTECLKGDTKALEALLEKIQENPVVQSSCYLPLNAALTVHYFKIKGYSLPSSEYEVFSTNILHCIRRHFEREGRGEELPAELASIDDLSRSEAVREPFQCLCELAYRGVMENKVTFSSNDLPQGSNTLSLLQAIESFLQSGKSVFYNFIHLSFQELLAGYYIATSLSDSEQVSQFHQLFHQPRFMGVFQFYAAITKLKTPGIDKIVSEIVSMHSNPHLLSLLRCLYEAQDPSLCQSVVNQLGELDVNQSSLSPMDLLSIGYLIGMSNTNVVKEVNLSRCHIGDYGVKHLMKYLARTKGTGTWKFELGWNNICEEGAASIAKVLHSNGVMNSLDLICNPSIGAGGLQSIAEALITNTSLVELRLYQCSLEITDENGPIVTEMLQRNKTLRKLDLIHTEISETGIVYIANGLEKNTALEWLRMNRINEVGGKALASAIAINASLPLVQFILDGRDMITEDSRQAFIDMLRQNTSIETLNLSCTGMSVPFLAEALQNNCTLKELNLNQCTLTPDMIKDVSKMLAVNHSLTSLNISSNPIGDDGVVHLAEDLKQNKTLEDLDISFCRITDAGVAPLAEALQVNNSLRELDVHGNDLTETGRTTLRELAARKSNLHVSL
jgi:Ran GTPase-activating protein (RanGAP) involved in mRNA processing and transport